MTPLEEKEKLLQTLKDSRETILNGGVVKFSKENTHYTLLSLDDLNKMIDKTETEILLLKNSDKLPDCGVCR